MLRFCLFFCRRFGLFGWCFGNFFLRLVLAKFFSVADFAADFVSARIHRNPDAFRVLATSGNDAQTHRLVHIVRYVRASVLAQDRLFANGFDPVP